MLKKKYILFIIFNNNIARILIWGTTRVFFYKTKKIIEKN